ncbi:hypothetical protein ACA910_001151 [Epithemia clementina (nom. ined.)]
MDLKHASTDTGSTTLGVDDDDDDGVRPPPSVIEINILTATAAPTGRTTNRTNSVVTKKPTSVSLKSGLVVSTSKLLECDERKNRLARRLFETRTNTNKQRTGNSTSNKHKIRVVRRLMASDRDQSTDDQKQEHLSRPSEQRLNKEGEEKLFQQQPSPLEFPVPIQTTQPVVKKDKNSKSSAQTEVADDSSRPVIETHHGGKRLFVLTQRSASSFAAKKLPSSTSADVVVDGGGGAEPKTRSTKGKSRSPSPHSDLAVLSTTKLLVVEGDERNSFANLSPVKRNKKTELTHNFSWTYKIPILRGLVVNTRDQNTNDQKQEQPLQTSAERSSSDAGEQEQLPQFSSAPPELPALVHIDRSKEEENHPEPSAKTEHPDDFSCQALAGQNHHGGEGLAIFAPRGAPSFRAKKKSPSSTIAPGVVLATGGPKVKKTKKSEIRSLSTATTNTTLMRRQPTKLKTWNTNTSSIRQSIKVQKKATRKNEPGPKQSKNHFEKYRRRTPSGGSGGDSSSGDGAFKTIEEGWIFDQGDSTAEKVLEQAERLRTDRRHLRDRQQVLQSDQHFLVLNRHQLDEERQPPQQQLQHQLPRIEQPLVQRPSFRQQSCLRPESRDDTTDSQGSSVPPRNSLSCPFSPLNDRNNDSDSPLTVQAPLFLHTPATSAFSKVGAIPSQQPSPPPNTTSDKNVAAPTGKHQEAKYNGEGQPPKKRHHHRHRRRWYQMEGEGEEPTMPSKNGLLEQEATKATKKCDQQQHHPCPDQRHFNRQPASSCDSTSAAGSSMEERKDKECSSTAETASSMQSSSSKWFSWFAVRVDSSSYSSSCGANMGTSKHDRNYFDVVDEEEDIDDVANRSTDSDEEYNDRDRRAPSSRRRSRESLFKQRRSNTMAVNEATSSIARQMTTALNHTLISASRTVMDRHCGAAGGGHDVEEFVDSRVIDHEQEWKCYDRVKSIRRSDFQVPRSLRGHPAEAF